MKHKKGDIVKIKRITKKSCHYNPRREYFNKEIMLKEDPYPNIEKRLAQAGYNVIEGFFIDDESYFFCCGAVIK